MKLRVVLLAGWRERVASKVLWGLLHLMVSFVILWTLGTQQKRIGIAKIRVLDILDMVRG